MKSYVSTAVLALLLATSGASLAQEKSAPGGQGAERGSGQGDGPGAGGGSGDAARGGSGGQSGAKDAPSGRSGQSDRDRSGGRGDGGEPKRQTQGPAAKDGQASQGQSGGEGGRRQGEAKSSDKQSDKQQRAQDRSAGAKSEAKDTRPATKDRSRSEQTETQKQQQRSQGRTEDATPRRDRASEGAASGEQGTSRPDQRRQAPVKGDADRAGADQQRTAKERAQITTEQRDRVRNLIREERPRRAASVNVDIRVGRRLPRNVTLLPLPSSVIEVVPDYRDYRYVYVRDEIVVVDPNTYEVVTVIDDRGTQRRAGSSSSGKRQAALTLTQSERQILFRYAAYDQAYADVQFRLGLGAEVPESVELFRFPEQVLTRVKKLEPYRYVVVEGRTILIVDPDDRQIELVAEPR